MAVQHNPKGSWTNTSNIGHLSHKKTGYPGGSHLFWSKHSTPRLPLKQYDAESTDLEAYEKVC